MRCTIMFSEAAGRLMVSGIPLGVLTRVAAALASRYPQRVEDPSGAEAGVPVRAATVHNASFAELEAVLRAELKDEDDLSFQSKNDRQEFAFDRFELHQVVDS